MPSSLLACWSGPAVDEPGILLAQGNISRSSFAVGEAAGYAIRTLPRVLFRYDDGGEDGERESKLAAAMACCGCCKPNLETNESASDELTSRH